MFELLRVRKEGGGRDRESRREGNYGHGDEGGGEGRGEGLFSIPPSAREGEGEREANQRKGGKEGRSTRLLAEQATRKIGHTGEGETANGSDIANDLPPARRPRRRFVRLQVRHVSRAIK